jgi:hypothetical protein
MAILRQNTFVPLLKEDLSVNHTRDGLLHMALNGDAAEVITGFNFAVCSHLLSARKCYLGCSAWKDRFNRKIPFCGYGDPYIKPFYYSLRQQPMAEDMYTLHKCPVHICQRPRTGTGLPLWPGERSWICVTPIVAMFCLFTVRVPWTHYIHRIISGLGAILLLSFDVTNRNQYPNQCVSVHS